MKRSFPLIVRTEYHLARIDPIAFASLGFALCIALLSVLLVNTDWFQLLGAKIYADVLPDDLKDLTAEGQASVDGIIYFDLTHFGTDGNPQAPGNYLMAFDTSTNEFTARRMIGNGLQYQRHSHDLLSFYELLPQVVGGQRKGEKWAGIPTQNGGYYHLLDSAGNSIGSIEDDRGLDLHELLLTPEGNYIYLITDTRLLYEDHTITCLMVCYMFGQSIIEVTPDGQELYRYDLLDYYQRDDFIMDDVFSLEDVKLYDMTHANSIDLHNNTLLISNRHTNEVLAIDRFTGDVVWRTRDMEFVNDDGFSHQHDAHITSAGTLLLFDNANGKDNQVSRAVEYRIDDDKLIRVWEYSNGHFQPNRGSARRLSDGSTLINFVTHIELVKDDEPILTITFPDYYTSYQADWWNHEKAN